MLLLLLLLVLLLHFSALQRAENSSIREGVRIASITEPFQCSSASRKFLNRTRRSGGCAPQRISVLFSEPKIPQFQSVPARQKALGISVLFSEPKIPQFLDFADFDEAANAFQCSSASRKFLNWCSATMCRPERRNFSALQRAENSSIPPALLRSPSDRLFQCSSASRKFLNPIVQIGA